jgi:hypothetical protein
MQDRLEHIQWLLAEVERLRGEAKRAVGPQKPGR